MFTVRRASANVYVPLVLLVALNAASALVLLATLARRGAFAI